jgi:hypothetical protein
MPGTASNATLTSLQQIVPEDHYEAVPPTLRDIAPGDAATQTCRLAAAASSYTF